MPASRDGVELTIYADITDPNRVWLRGGLDIDDAVARSNGTVLKRNLIESGWDWDTKPKNILPENKITWDGVKLSVVPDPDYTRVPNKDERIKDLEAENAAIKARLDSLESR